MIYFENIRLRVKKFKFEMQKIKKYELTSEKMD